MTSFDALMAERKGLARALAEGARLRGLDRREAVSRAQAYVDKVLDAQRALGYVSEVSDAEYRRAIDRAAHAFVELARPDLVPALDREPLIGRINSTDELYDAARAVEVSARQPSRASWLIPVDGEALRRLQAALARLEPKRKWAFDKRVRHDN